MEEVTISELRTHCYAILRRIYETRCPVRVTRHGKVVGHIAPVPVELLDQVVNPYEEDPKGGG